MTKEQFLYLAESWMWARTRDSVSKTKADQEAIDEFHKAVEALFELPSIHPLVDPITGMSISSKEKAGHLTLSYRSFDEALAAHEAMVGAIAVLNSKDAKKG